MRSLLLFAALAPFAFAQLDDNTITVTATRSFILQPDQVVIGVVVTAQGDAGLDDLLPLLDGTNITAANLTGAFQSVQNETQWSFRVTVPLAKMTDELKSLEAARP